MPEGFKTKNANIAIIHPTIDIAASKIHSQWKEYWTADRDKRILELNEQMNLLRMDSRDTIDSQNVIIFEQTNRIKELEKEVHRLQFSL